MAKYHNRKVVADGVTFDSRKEARRYAELKLLEQTGQIKDLQLQVKFELIPAQREPDKIGPKGGTKQGKTIEKECAYYADFVYIDCVTGETVVEDAKGVRTEVYKIKRKLMLQKHGIRIREV